MSPLVFLILGLAILAAVVSVQGRRTNLRLQKILADLLEAALEPTSTEYTDIGGTVGFTFEFSRSGIPPRVSGSLTMFPRQALFYYPIAKFLGREDALTLLAPVPGMSFGEGHLVNRSFLDDGRIEVDGAEEMERTHFSEKGVDLAVLSYNPVVRELFLGFAEGCPHPESIRHFSYSRKNDSFFLRMEPHPEILVQCVSYWIRFLMNMSEQ